MKQSVKLFSQNLYCSARTTGLFGNHKELVQFKRKYDTTHGYTYKLGSLKFRPEEFCFLVMDEIETEKMLEMPFHRLPGLKKLQEKKSRLRWNKLSIMVYKDDGCKLFTKQYFEDYCHKGMGNIGKLKAALAKELGPMYCWFVQLKQEESPELLRCCLVVTKKSVSLLHTDWKMIHFHKICGNNLRLYFDSSTNELTLNFIECCEWTGSSSNGTFQVKCSFGDDIKKKMDEVLTNLYQDWNLMIRNHDFHPHKKTTQCLHIPECYIENISDSEFLHGFGTKRNVADWVQNINDAHDDDDDLFDQISMTNPVPCSMLREKDYEIDYENEFLDPSETFPKEFLESFDSCAYPEDTNNNNSVKSEFSGNEHSDSLEGSYVTLRKDAAQCFCSNYVNLGHHMQKNLMRNVNKNNTLSKNMEIANDSFEHEINDKVCDVESLEFGEKLEIERAHSPVENEEQASVNVSSKSPQWSLKSSWDDGAFKKSSKYGISYEDLTRLAKKGRQCSRGNSQEGIGQSWECSMSFAAKNRKLSDVGCISVSHDESLTIPKCNAWNIRTEIDQDTYWNSDLCMSIHSCMCERNIQPIISWKFDLSLNQVNGICVYLNTAQDATVKDWRELAIKYLNLTVNDVEIIRYICLAYHYLFPEFLLYHWILQDQKNRDVPPCDFQTLCCIIMEMNRHDILKILNSRSVNKHVQLS